MQAVADGPEPSSLTRTILTGRLLVSRRLRGGEAMVQGCSRSGVGVARRKLALALFWGPWAGPADGVASDAVALREKWRRFMGAPAEGGLAQERPPAILCAA